MQKHPFKWIGASLKQDWGKNGVGQNEECQSIPGAMDYHICQSKQTERHQTISRQQSLTINFYVYIFNKQWLKISHDTAWNITITVKKKILKHSFFLIISEMLIFLQISQTWKNFVTRFISYDSVIKKSSPTHY